MHIAHCKLCIFHIKTCLNGYLMCTRRWHIYATRRYTSLHTHTNTHTHAHTLERCLYPLIIIIKSSNNYQTSRTNHLISLILDCVKMCTRGWHICAIVQVHIFTHTHTLERCLYPLNSKLKSSNNQQTSPTNHLISLIIDCSHCTLHTVCKDVYP